MEINSTDNGALVNGTDANDNIQLYGNRSTVNAMGGDDIISVNGGRHDNGVWIYGDETDLVNAGDGNDSISVYSRGASIIGGNGNDTVTINRDYTFADGGADNDVIHIFGGYSTSVENITVTGGAGNDTIQIEPRYNKNIGVIVTDFSNDDTFRLDDIAFGISSRNLTQNNSSGNVVIQDTSENQPLNMTLQGVSDISQVADARYIRYYEGTPYGSSTFGELFGVTSSGSSSPGNSSSSENTPTSQTSTSQTSTVPATNGGTTIINNYYGDVYVINVTGGIYVYNGGNKVINNYQQGEVVRLDSDFQGVGVSGNSFLVNSSTGSLEIQESRDKFISYAYGNSDVIATSYLASGGGEIDGRNQNVWEVMSGADNADNQIYAGNSGSSLWGGQGGNDTLSGGDGADEFVYKPGSGNDVVQDAGDNDLVNLDGVNFSQLVNASVNERGIDATFQDGGSLKVEGNSNLNFRIEGTTYCFNRSDGSWTTK